MDHGSGQARCPESLCAIRPIHGYPCARVRGSAWLSGALEPVLCPGEPRSHAGGDTGDHRDLGDLPCIDEVDGVSASAASASILAS